MTNEEVAKISDRLVVGIREDIEYTPPEAMEFGWKKVRARAYRVLRGVIPETKKVKTAEEAVSADAEHEYLSAQLQVILSSLPKEEAKQRLEALKIEALIKQRDHGLGDVGQQEPSGGDDGA